jgi:hypothetical protein
VRHEVGVGRVELVRRREVEAEPRRLHCSRSLLSRAPSLFLVSCPKSNPDRPFLVSWWDFDHPLVLGFPWWDLNHARSLSWVLGRVVPKWKRRRRTLPSWYILDELGFTGGRGRKISPNSLC